jgi:hypothetical protein
MGMGAVHAAGEVPPVVSTPTTTTTTAEAGLMTELSNALGGLFLSGRVATIDETIVDTKVVGRLTTYAAPNVDITALAGAVNLSAINGSIDISGTNVSITNAVGAVAATADAKTTSTALAINGNNFSTTVIGAMNSSTLDIMGKITDKTNASTTGMGITSLASQGGTLALSTPSVLAATDATVASIGNSIDSIKVLDGASKQGNTITGDVASNLQLDMHGLTSSTTSNVSDKVTELQSMNVFNMALNVAPLVAGVKIAAAVDTNAWFLNPQTGIVNLSGLQIATTAIGAMNSSVTHLGANLTTALK